MDATQTMLQMILKSAENFAQNSLNSTMSNYEYTEDNAFKDMLNEKSESAQQYDTQNKGQSTDKVDSKDDAKLDTSKPTTDKSDSEQGEEEYDAVIQLALNGADGMIYNLTSTGFTVADVEASTTNMAVLQEVAVQGAVSQNVPAQAGDVLQNNMQGEQNAQQTDASANTQQADIVQTAQSTQGEQNAQSGQGEQNANTNTDTLTTQNTADKQTEVDGAEQGVNTQNAVFDKTEHMPVKVGQTATQPQTQAQQPSAALAETIITAQANGQDQVTIKLTPENLGNLVIDIQRSPTGALSIIMKPDTEIAAKLLSEHANSLGNLLGNNSSEVKIIVEQPQEADRMWQQADQDANKNGNNQNSQQSKKQEESEDFMNKLRLGLFTIQSETA